MHRVLFSLLLCLTLAATALAQEDNAPAHTELAEISYVQDPLRNIPPPQTKLAYSIVIENRRGGLIRAVEPPASFLFNRPGVDLGTVLQPVRRLRTDIPEARLPAPPNVVCQSGTDGIHIKAWNRQEYGTDAVLSILPADNVNYMEASQPAQATLEPGEVLLTDIPAGREIFGGAWPLIVGNPVNVYRGQNILAFSPEYAGLEIGDMIVIGVYTPADWPDSLRIANKTGDAVEWVLAGESLELAQCALAQDGARSQTLSGPLPAAGIAMTSSTSFVLGLFGGDGRQGFAVNCRGYGSQPGLQLLTTSEVALPWQAPLFNGYLYPWNPADPPKRLPLPVLRVRFGSGSSWVPLASVTEPATLDTITALRIDWLPPGSLDDSRVLSETVRDLEIGPAK